MNHVYLVGQVVRILQDTTGLQIFVVRTDEREPQFIRVKRFADQQAVSPRVLTGDAVLVHGRLRVAPMRRRDQGIVRTTDGKPVYAFDVNADLVRVVSDAREVTPGVSPSGPVSPSELSSDSTAWHPKPLSTEIELDAPPAPF